MRAVRAIAVILAVLGGGVAVAAGQGSVPTVTVTATATDVTASPAPVAPGATRFEFVESGLRREAGVYLATPKPGRTADELTAAIRANPDSSFEVGDIVTSASLAPGDKRAITVEIEADRAYLLVNDLGKENPRDWIIAPLATGGAPTGATAPAPDAAVVMRDLRFGGDRTLPRNGTVRVRNVGWAPHFAIAAALKPGARRAAVGRALRGNRERALGRVVSFRRSLELTNILTRGAVTDQEVTFSRRGRYVLVCFFEGHNAQGMYRFVRVR
jgi:uncharacterized cupredoxin-like copper-binding protein